MLEVLAAVAVQVLVEQVLVALALAEIVVEEPAETVVAVAVFVGIVVEAPVETVVVELADIVAEELGTANILNL